MTVSGDLRRQRRVESHSFDVVLVDVRIPDIRIHREALEILPTRRIDVALPSSTIHPPRDRNIVLLRGPLPLPQSY